MISYIYFYTFQENNIVILFYINNTFKITYYSQAMRIKLIKMFLMVYTYYIQYRLRVQYEYELKVFKYV